MNNMVVPTPNSRRDDDCLYCGSPVLEVGDPSAPSHAVHLETGWGCEQHKVEPTAADRAAFAFAVYAAAVVENTTVSYNASAVVLATLLGDRFSAATGDVFCEVIEAFSDAVDGDHVTRSDLADLIDAVSDNLVGGVLEHLRPMLDRRDRSSSRRVAVRIPVDGIDDLRLLRSGRP